MACNCGKKTKNVSTQYRSNKQPRRDRQQTIRSIRENGSRVIRRTLQRY